ncbi:hypothetical protein M514_08924 [Trichuris suis]|uniref:HD domain-containing protein n=1 Tax=Trichuris suis TaxID=68888 RepID=A0A085NLS6_9BILA|nr:hypothetical protein M513_08924 [Trichuris suis]KFD70422.1 hypothetical protein M514_08924 [Trichuris suis]
MIRIQAGHVKARGLNFAGDFCSSADGIFGLEPEGLVVLLIRVELLGLQSFKKLSSSIFMDAAAEDLKRRWNLLNADAVEEVKSAWWKRILETYTAPSRHFHNILLVHRTFLLYDRCKHLLTNRYAVAFAIFFHDICYDATSNSNEHESALEFQKFSKETVINQPECVIDLIERRGSIAQDESKIGDAEYFSDLQLAVLGSTEQEYEEYKRNLRLECCHLNDDAYRAQRLKLLKTLLLIPNIFRTSFFRELFEKQSRENVQKEIDELVTGR